MARKVQPVDILPPPCSSDDETEDVEGSSSSTDDDEQHATHPQKPQEQEDSDEPEPEPEPEKPSLQEPQESEESDDDSGETQNSPSVSAFIVKPISKPTKSGAKPKPIVPKPVLKSPEPETPTSKPTKSRAKRPAESEEIAKASRTRVNNMKRPAETEVEKNKMSKLSNGDGQSVGKVDKGSKSKKVVSGDKEGSEGIVTEGSDSKVKSSKKRHKKKDGIVVSNTNTSVATNSELSMQEEVKDTTLEDKKEETQDYWLLYPRLCASLESEASGYSTVMPRYIKEYVKEIISGMGEEMARELEDGWKAIHVMGRQLYVRRANLINKLAQAAVDSLKNF